MITDSHGRVINYLRLAVTDRCNLRCTYCMPETGLNWLPRKDLMTHEEMIRICRLMVRMGISKIRITGGEPFIRKDLMPLLNDLHDIKGLNEITITTNGLLTEPYIPELKRLGIHRLNLSLDTLDPARFKAITRRDDLDRVLRTLDALLSQGLEVKINTVVMEGRNIEDIAALVTLTKSLPLSVRFIEEMPFNGGKEDISLKWNFAQILAHIKLHFPNLEKAQDAPYGTSLNYRVPGFKGSIGIIPAYTRSFCGSCNRLRLTPKGVLRTCLYEAGSFNLKDAIREGMGDNELQAQLMDAILHKPKDGWEAEADLITRKLEHQSMATIGG